MRYTPTGNEKINLKKKSMKQEETSNKTLGFNSASQELQFPSQVTD